MNYITTVKLYRCTVTPIMKNELSSCDIYIISPNIIIIYLLAVTQLISPWNNELFNDLSASVLVIGRPADPCMEDRKYSILTSPIQDIHVRTYYA